MKNKYLALLIIVLTYICIGTSFAGPLTDKIARQTQIITLLEEKYKGMTDAFTNISNELDNANNTNLIQLGEIQSLKFTLETTTAEVTKLQGIVDTQAATIIEKDGVILAQKGTIEKKDITIGHHKSFARQIALVCAILTALALGFGLAQFIGRLPQPYSTYGLPILIGVALAGGYIVYTTITVYASKIA